LTASDRSGSAWLRADLVQRKPANLRLSSVGSCSSCATTSWSKRSARQPARGPPPTLAVIPAGLLPPRQPVIMAWAMVGTIGRSQVAGCSPRLLHRPCRARPADRSLVADDRSAAGVRDRVGPEPAGTRWVHAEPAGRGLQRAQAVTSGSEEPQVKPPTQPRPGRASEGGPEFESSRLP
jgi:hypothetical protein